MKTRTVRLGAVCEFIRGVTFDKADATTRPEVGKTPVLRAGNIGEELDAKNNLIWVPDALVSDEQRLRQNDIAICMSSGSPQVVGKTARVPCNLRASIGSFCGIIRPQSPDEASYLSFFFRSAAFRKHRNTIARGANIQNLRFSQFEEIELEIPSEQRRIAGQLEQANRLRLTRRYALKISDRFLQAVFLEIFGDPATNPRNWKSIQLGDLVDEFEGGVNFNPVSEGEPSSVWRVLKISSVTSGEFKPYESKPIPPDTKFDDLLVVRRGDLIFSRANTTELVGAVCMVRQTPPNVLLPDKLWRIKLRCDSQMEPNYLLHFLQLPHSRKTIGDLATGTSGSMKNISKEKTGTIRILLPPTEQQERFAAVVLCVERLRLQQREADRQAKHLFQTLLDRAFAEYA